MTAKIEVVTEYQQGWNDGYDAALRMMRAAPEVKHISPTPLELLAERNGRLEREVERLKTILRKAGVTGAPGPTGEWVPDETTACACGHCLDCLRVERAAPKTDAPRTADETTAVVYKCAVAHEWMPPENGRIFCAKCPTEKTNEGPLVRRGPQPGPDTYKR